MKSFIAPSVLSLVIFAAAYAWGGVEAFFLVVLLSMLEISLSFDNAVVNAKVLEHMTPVWQKRFLTWGMLIAVVGTRLVLPAIVVAIAAVIPPLDIVYMAFYQPDVYAEHVLGAHAAIAAFGGAYLLMVALSYFFDASKDFHWLGAIESRLTRWGEIEAISIAITLGILLFAAFTAKLDPASIMTAGCIGIVLFIFIEGLAHLLGDEAGSITRGSAVLFVYLNILDATFSLDGVIGAFALTTSLPIIVAGLGVGAYFVRSLTVHFVRHKTLKTLVYLEHGAYWAIFSLALCMLYGINHELPEVIPGVAGLLFIGAAYFSSVRAKSA